MAELFKYLLLLFLSVGAGEIPSNAVDCGTSDLNSRIEDALYSQHELEALYNDYKVNHGVEHHDGETQQRLKLFRESLKEIKELKANNEVSWNVGITFMSHLTECERSLYHGDNNTIVEKETNLYASNGETGDIAPAWDWRDVGAVGPVHKQKENTCWAHSAIVPIEAQLKVLKGKFAELSTQELVDCTYFYTYGGYDGFGKKQDCWEWMKEFKRIGYRRDIPDREISEHCPNHAKHDNALVKYKMSSIRENGYIDTNGMIFYKVDKIYKIDLKEKEELPLLKILNKKSPVSVSMQIANAKLHTYNGGPYDWRTGGCKNGEGHAMAIVGYSESYYFFKNSWGSSWGDNGYLWWVRAPGGFNCNIYNLLYYPIVKVDDW